MRSEVSSRLRPCSKLRVPPRGNTGLPRSSLRSPPSRRKRPRFIPSLPREGTGQPLSVNASSTTASPKMPVTTSTNAAGAKVVTVQLEATTSTRAGVMTAWKIVAHHPSRRALGFLARPFTKHYFLFGFAPQQLSPSITVRPNLNFGSLIAAWLVSWAGPPMTVSSFDSFPFSYRTPLEHGSRTSHLDRSMTRMTW
jgi:hypothetical protein